MERDLNGIPIAKVPMELLSESRTKEQESTYNYIKDVITKTKRDEQNAAAADLGIQTRYHVAEGKSADFDKKDSRPAS